MKRTIIRIISMTLLILTFFAIFNLSAQNGEQSGSLSNKVTTIFINHFPYTKNLSIETKQKLIEHTEPIVRKLAHFSIYGLVGIFIMTFMSTFQTRLYKKWIISMIVGVGYASFDEYHQSFVAGRGPSVIDVGIDSLGVLAGIFAVLIIISIYRALKSDKKIKNTN